MNDKHKRLQLCSWGMFQPRWRFAVTRGSCSWIIHKRWFVLACGRCSVEVYYSMIPGLAVIHTSSFSCDQTPSLLLSPGLHLSSFSFCVTWERWCLLQRWAVVESGRRAHNGQGRVVGGSRSTAMAWWTRLPLEPQSRGGLELRARRGLGADAAWT